MNKYHIIYILFLGKDGFIMKNARTIFSGEEMDAEIELAPISFLSPRFLARLGMELPNGKPYPEPKLEEIA